MTVKLHLGIVIKAAYMLTSTDHALLAQTRGLPFNEKTGDLILHVQVSYIKQITIPSR